MPSTRRSFLSAAAVCAVANGAARKIRVGAMNVGEFSFWGIWADILSAQGGLGTTLLNMEVTHCWDVNPKAAAAALCYRQGADLSQPAF